MAHHVVTEEQLNEWRVTQWFEFAASFSAVSNKRLEVGLDGLYRVTDHGKVRYIGAAKATAIREYNNAQ